jgi:hypothetical protein
MSRANPVREPPGGDWGFLVSGDSLQVVLNASEYSAPGAEGAFRVWARLDLNELQWPDATLTWGETRAFERARREVPVALSLTSFNGQMRAELSVLNAEVRAGAGEGPQLPVDALFEIAGTLRIGTAAYPVRGFLRHLQP